ncbi:hypothetical protein KKF84_04110 [Myxococcota bacterium]|nr:hypothetical protein [Myxococcota bacterium]MBU1534479.1 hypothetical protein [Myxococcota bacterium]
MDSRQKLLCLKIAHTIIWLFFALIICYIPMAAIADRIAWYTYVAAGLVIGEALVLFAYSWHCPLTVVGKRYVDNPEEGFDIFLPVWVARHNKTIFTSIYVIGIMLLAWRAFT